MFYHGFITDAHFKIWKLGLNKMGVLVFMKQLLVMGNNSRPPYIHIIASPAFPVILHFCSLV